MTDIRVFGDDLRAPVLPPRRHLMSIYDLDRPVIERLAVHWQAGKPLEQFAEGLRKKTGGEHADAGRNEPCPCGSGRKYKKCCLATQRAREKEPA